MSKHFIGTVLGLTIATLSMPSFAQFGGLGGALGGGGGGGSSVSADSLVKSYVAGTQQVMSSDASFLKALGMKEQAERVELSAKNLTTGPTSATLEDANKIQTESSKLIGDGMTAQKGALSADSKKDYVRGVVELVKGIKSYAGMTGDVKNFKPGMSSLGSAAGAAMYVVKSLPGSLSNLQETLKRSLAFAKENKIELPADATAALPK
jgi:hypothetical protein